MRFIFITGGVISSIGKGIVASSIGSLLQTQGYKIRIRKIDPYLNIDPGTMSPYEHGEVFVTKDGAETDLDLGHYERFTDINCSSTDSISAGQIFDYVIKKERKGDYLGNTVQIIPHITDEIKRRIELDLRDEDFLICEIGGTVGDIEATPFLEAIRQFSNEKGKQNVLFVHVTLLPYLHTSKEVKTKPTQHSVKELQRAGIFPNILLCRSQIPLSENEINKLSLFCNVSKQDIIPALECSNLNQVIINYHNEGLKDRVLTFFYGKDYNNKNQLPAFDKNNFFQVKGLSLWEDLVTKENKSDKVLNLHIVAKYLKNNDAYISLKSALKHSAVDNLTKLNINWIDAELLEKNDLKEVFKNTSGILIPGGYGIRGTKGKIRALEYGRVNNIPTLGICLGAQLMVIEVLCNIAKLSNVGSEEFGEYEHNAISLLTEWKNNDTLQKRNKNENLGGSMRLGSFPCKIKKDSLAMQIYNQHIIYERHRHRYEINIKYKEILENCNMIISGTSPDELLPEIVELKKHMFFLGVQFHPEFKSRPFSPHPLLQAFIQAQLKYIYKY